MYININKKNKNKINLQNYLKIITTTKKQFYSPYFLIFFF